MLLQLTGKRRCTVAQSMIAALVATWLSLVCQQCLAYARDTQPVPDAADPGADCMVPTASGSAPVAGQPSCASECDCSAMVSASTVNPPKSLLPASVSDPVFVLPSSVTHVAFADFGKHVALPGSPDGVTPPLLERFCIHLE